MTALTAPTQTRRLDLPPAQSRWARSSSVFSYFVANYRRTWRGSLITFTLAPVLYLAAMGVGLGSLVNRHGSAHLGGVPYLDFVAPGLLAASAMQLAVGEASWGVLGCIKWQRQYFAMLAGPPTVDDVLTGHLLWITLRAMASCSVYLVAMAAFGSVRSWWAVLALPAATLVGVAFTTPIMAYSATVENDADFAVIWRFGVIPLLLFSGTFFPLSQLPLGMRLVAYVTPLWHGVALCRDLTLGTPQAGTAAIHVAYLLAWVVVGILLARRTFRTRLLL